MANAGINKFPETGCMLYDGNNGLVSYFIFINYSLSNYMTAELNSSCGPGKKTTSKKLSKHFQK